MLALTLSPKRDRQFYIHALSWKGLDSGRVLATVIKQGTAEEPGMLVAMGVGTGPPGAAVLGGRGTVASVVPSPQPQITGQFKRRHCSAGWSSNPRGARTHPNGQRAFQTFDY